jgi:hypothetical protein
MLRDGVPPHIGQSWAEARGAARKVRIKAAPRVVILSASEESK